MQPAPGPSTANNTLTMQLTLSILIASLVGVIVSTMSACGPESGSLRDKAETRNAQVEALMSETFSR